MDYKLGFLISWFEFMIFDQNYIWYIDFFHRGYLIFYFLYFGTLNGYMQLSYYVSPLFMIQFTMEVYVIGLYLFTLC